MTVEQLVAELAKMPPSAPVYTEGCDCMGCALAVQREVDGTVTICRYVGWSVHRSPVPSR